MLAAQSAVWKISASALFFTLAWFLKICNVLFLILCRFYLTFGHDKYINKKFCYLELYEISSLLNIEGGKEMNSDKNTLTYHILLKTTDNAVKFVNTINTLDGYFDICMGSYFFDAKSMLGILSMDPRRVMTLRVVRNDHSTDELETLLRPFCA